MAGFVTGKARALRELAVQTAMKVGRGNSGLKRDCSRIDASIRSCGVGRSMRGRS